jgi:hypothetical protein
MKITFAQRVWITKSFPLELRSIAGKPSISGVLVWMSCPWTRRWPGGLYSLALTGPADCREDAERLSRPSGDEGNFVPLAGGTRIRIPPSFHARVAITAPASAASLPLIAVWLQVRVLSEPTTKSIAVQALFAVAVGSRPKYREGAFIVRASCVHRPSRRKIRQSKAAGSFSPFCSPRHPIVRWVYSRRSTLGIT